MQRSRIGDNESLWPRAVPDCLATLRRLLETEPHGLGRREFIRVLRLLESYSLEQLQDAVEYALDIGVHRHGAPLSR